MWCFEKWMCKIEKIGSYAKINKKKICTNLCECSEIA